MNQTVEFIQFVKSSISDTGFCESESNIGICVNRVLRIEVNGVCQHLTY